MIILSKTLLLKKKKKKQWLTFIVSIFKVFNLESVVTTRTMLQIFIG